MKNNKALIWIMVALVLIGGTYAFWPQISAAATKIKDAATGNSGSSGQPDSVKVNGTTVVTKGLNLDLALSKGSRGQEVVKLQEMLNAFEVNNPLVLDGIFGNLTEAKLKRLNNGVGSITLRQALQKITTYTG